MRKLLILNYLVDLVGIEPTTSSMPWKRAPSCATGPHRRGQLLYCLRSQPIRQTGAPPPVNPMLPRNLRRKRHTLYRFEASTLVPNHRVTHITCSQRPIRNNEVEFDGVSQTRVPEIS